MVAMLAVSMVLAACGGDDDDAASGSDTTTAASAETSAGGATTAAAAGADTTAGAADTTTGGADTTAGVSDEDLDLDATLRISTTYPPSSLDPRATTGPVNPYQAIVYERLLRVDADSQLQPMLAESWEFSADGTQLIVKLRDDVSFHSGAKMDATAVKASLERWKTDPASLMAGTMAGITAIEATDPTTVTLTLAKPDASIPAVLATGAGTVLDPASFADTSINWDTSPGNVGSGPWLVSSFVPNQSATFERAPDPSWDPNAGKIKTIELSFTTDQAARINAMETDAADMAFINIGESPNVAHLTDTDDYVLHRLPAFLQVSLSFNVEREPFTDQTVRQAVKHAIDADLIGENLFSGDCAKASGIYPEVSWAHSEPTDPFPYDPDAAEQALAAAGLPDGFSFTVITNAGGGNNMASVAVQEQLRQVGIEMTVNAMQSVALTPIVQAKDFDAQMTNLGHTADPSGVLVNSFINGVNVAGPEGAPELQAIVDKANDPSLTQEERAEYFAEADQLIADNVWQVPICNAPIQWLTGSKVENVDAMSWIHIFEVRYLAIAA